MNNIQYPFYQQDYNTMNTNYNHHSMVLPQPLRLFNGNSKRNTLLASSPPGNHNLYYHHNESSMFNRQSYYPPPSFIQVNHKPCETTTPMYNQHQSWKPGHTTINELMFSDEMFVPTSSPSPPHNYYNNESHGLSMDSNSTLYNTSQQSFSNNSYASSPPPLSVSSSTSSSIYNYGNNYQGNTSSNHCNGLFYLNDSNHHYRRSSMNTSRSSSPSSSSSTYTNSPYQTSTRSPSPVVVNKRYACQICSKRFTRPSSLTTHIYSHTGEKPFKCTVNGCGRHFSVVSNLRRHAKVHGNINIKTSSSSATAKSF